MKFLSKTLQKNEYIKHLETRISSLEWQIKRMKEQPPMPFVHFYYEDAPTIHAFEGHSMIRLNGSEDIMSIRLDKFLKKLMEKIGVKLIAKRPESKPAQYEFENEEPEKEKDNG